jgi:hypothetical protein
MSARKPVLLTYEALHQILVAAGRWPADLNVSDLNRQLSKAIYDYHQLCVPNIKAQKARLKSIRKRADELAALLRADEEYGGVDWCSPWPKAFPPPSKIVEEIQRMAEESGILELSAQKIKREIIPNSPREWLVGTRLPLIFEQFFREPWTVTREGRYLAFAERVLIEFKIPCSRETIIRALTRAGRSRRRNMVGKSN